METPPRKDEQEPASNEALNFLNEFLVFRKVGSLNKQQGQNEVEEILRQMRYVPPRLSPLSPGLACESPDLELAQILDDQEQYAHQEPQQYTQHSSRQPQQQHELDNAVQFEYINAAERELRDIN